MYPRYIIFRMAASHADVLTTWVNALPANGANHTADRLVPPIDVSHVTAADLELLADKVRLRPEYADKALIAVKEFMTANRPAQRNNVLTP